MKRRTFVLALPLIANAATYRDDATVDEVRRSIRTFATDIADRNQWDGFGTALQDYFEEAFRDFLRSLYEEKHIADFWLMRRSQKKKLALHIGFRTTTLAPYAFTDVQFTHDGQMILEIKVL